MFSGTTIDQLYDMSLLEIDKRINLIIEAKKESQRGFLHDLGYVIFCATNHAYSITKAPKGKQQGHIKSFQEALQGMLQIDTGEDKNNTDPEQSLKEIFG